MTPNKHKNETAHIQDLLTHEIRFAREVVGRDKPLPIGIGTNSSEKDFSLRSK